MGGHGAPSVSVTHGYPLHDQDQDQASSVSVTRGYPDMIHAPDHVIEQHPLPHLPHYGHQQMSHLDLSALQAAPVPVCIGAGPRPPQASGAVWESPEVGTLGLP